MTKSNLVVFVDLDGTVVHVGDRFTSNPPPAGIKDRKNPVYMQWLLDIQTPELLAQDKPVPGTQQLMGALERSVYLTSRSDIHLADTLLWLRTHHYPPRELIMRKEGDPRGYAEMKEDAIKNYLERIAKEDGSLPGAYNVIVFDDDVPGRLEEVCERNNWTFFRACSGGKVL